MVAGEEKRREERRGENATCLSDPHTRLTKKIGLAPSSSLPPFSSLKPPSPLQKPQKPHPNAHPVRLFPHPPHRLPKHLFPKNPLRPPCLQQLPDNLLGEFRVALHGEDAGGDVEALDGAAGGGAEEGGGGGGGRGVGRHGGEDVFVHLMDVLLSGGGWGVSYWLRKGFMVVGGGEGGRGRHANSSFPKSSFPFSVMFTAQTLTSHPPSTPSLRLTSPPSARPTIWWP